VEGIAARLVEQFPELPAAMVVRVVRECYDVATDADLPELRVRVEELARARLVVHLPAQRSTVEP
jgi:hypothetical protein